MKSEKSAAPSRNPERARPTQREPAAQAGVHPLLRPLGNQAAGQFWATGVALSSRTRQEMESRFGEDFSDVRVHVGPDAAARARSERAAAFALGRDIVFGANQYQPDNLSGKSVLAHELAHVVQQSRGGPAESPVDGSEKDANVAAAAVAAGNLARVTVSSAPRIDRLGENDELIAKLARDMGLPEPREDPQEIKWTGKPPSAGVQEAAREALAEADSHPTISVWLGKPPLAAQLQQRRQQKQAQAELDRTDPGATAPPIPKKTVSALPPASVLTRPEPPPTGFETQLRSGKSFVIKIHPKAEVDPRTAVWVGKRPTDEQMRNMRFQDVDDPSKRIWVDEGTARDLRVDRDSTLPVRHPTTYELTGYRVRHGDTITDLDRNGEVRDMRGLEQPLEQDAVDPIDGLMVAGDLGPLAVKAVQGAVKAVLKGVAKSGARELGTVAGDETATLLSREVADALERGVSHPRDFPEVDLRGKPFNDLHPSESPSARAGDVLSEENLFHLEDYRLKAMAQAEEDALQQADRIAATGGRAGGRGRPVTRAPSRTVDTVAANAAARTATGRVAGEAAKAGPTITRFGKREVDALTVMWKKKLLQETEPEGKQQIRRYLEALKDPTRVRDWPRSEEEMRYLYSLRHGGKGATAYEVDGAGGVHRITIPDFETATLRGEVKNWEMINIPSESLGKKMLADLADQVQTRRLIVDFKDQIVVLDLRGQKLTEHQIQQIGRTFSETTGLPPSNVHIALWK